MALGTGFCAGAAQPTVAHFPSEDRRTTLVGYLFIPETSVSHPAIVLLHGRAGAYSSLAHGVYDAATLSKRHKEWGEFWAARGYAALLVDSFGPRGYPAGFGRNSYKERPPEVSEQTVRPLDAYGALKYLRTRADIAVDRIGLQGWSNGGMTVLVTMSRQSPGRPRSQDGTGFRAALAEYPGCGMDAIKSGYKAYAPVFMMIAGADEEVSPQQCESFAATARENGSALQFIVYPGASHNFDDPSKSKQSIPANHRATVDAMRQAERFFKSELLR